MNSLVRGFIRYSLLVLLSKNSCQDDYVKLDMAAGTGISAVHPFIHPAKQFLSAHLIDHEHHHRPHRVGALVEYIVVKHCLREK